MPASKPPRVDCDQVNPLLVVNDIDAAFEFYSSKLGFSTGFIWGSPPSMAGMVLDKVAVHLSKGEPKGNAVYFAVGDADELYEFHKDHGAEITVEPGDRNYGMRDYTVRDPWGNFLSFGHFIPVFEPSLPIERVELSIRLEKRLAALLKDLAEHKGMTIGACLEETLLHTFEVTPNEEGVASPHTKKTHNIIQQLKKRHGIDYDVHASYRFVEKNDE